MNDIVCAWPPVRLCLEGNWLSGSCHRLLGQSNLTAAIAIMRSVWKAQSTSTTEPGRAKKYVTAMLSIGLQLPHLLHMAVSLSHNHKLGNPEAPLDSRADAIYPEI